MKSIKTLLIISFLLIAVASWSIDDNAGTNGFNFLKINYSAKAAAMGGAYSAMSGEADGYHYNPAIIREVMGRSFSTGYLNYFDGYNGGTAIYNIHGETASIAIFGEYITSGDIDAFLEDGTADGTYSASDVLIGASIAREVHPMLTVGISAKYIMETIDSNSATAVAADIGLIHQPANKHLKVGLTIRNIGYQVTYFSDSEYKEKFPVTYAAGLRYTFSERVLATIELDKAAGQEIAGGIGCDMKIHPMFAARGGYKFDSSDWNTDSNYFSGLSFGIGMNWNRFVLDYAISSYGDLGTLNHVSLRYAF